MELVGLKIKIQRKTDGGKRVNDYPNFNSLPAVVRADMDWSSFIDAFGTGWHYDKISGFGESDVENPDPAVQYGITCVPEDFAVAAVAAFPDRCEIIDEAEVGRFHDERATAHMPEERIDRDIIDGIRAKHGITGSLDDERGRPGSPLTDGEKQAIDPEHPSPGIRKNWRKRWSDLKARRGITIKAPADVGGGE